MRQAWIYWLCQGWREDQLQLCTPVTPLLRGSDTEPQQPGPQCCFCGQQPASVRLLQGWLPKSAIIICNNPSWEALLSHALLQDRDKRLCVCRGKEQGTLPPYQQTTTGHCRGQGVPLLLPLLRPLGKNSNWQVKGGRRGKSWNNFEFLYSEQNLGLFLIIYSDRLTNQGDLSTKNYHRHYFQKSTKPSYFTVPWSIVCPYFSRSRDNSRSLQQMTTDSSWRSTVGHWALLLVSQHVAAGLCFACFNQEFLLKCYPGPLLAVPHNKSQSFKIPRALMFACYPNNKVPTNMLGWTVLESPNNVQQGNPKLPKPA